MVGINITTEANGGQAEALLDASSQAFFTGLTERGDIDAPIRVRGIADVELLTGARVSYGVLYDQLATFFSEGGVQAYISRVVGPGATAGTLTLQDRAGTPANTLKVDAANPGAWSSTLKVEVREGSRVNTFRIIVSLGDDVVHDFNNISSPAEAAIKFANSAYVKVTNLGAATAAPNNNPKVLAATALSAGTDDRANVDDDDYIAALNRASIDLGDGAVAIPGRNSSAIFEAIDAHCKANRRIGILAGDLDDDIAALVSLASSIDSDALGMFGPWLNVSNDFGGVRAISPEGYVMAVRARAHIQDGPWRAPAGAIAKSEFIQGAVTKYTTADIDDLEAGKVNAIRQIGSSVRLYGWKSLTDDTENWEYLKDRDLINYLVVKSEATLEDYVFAPIDGKGHTLSAIRQALVGILEPIRLEGGLYENVNELGEQVDPGYSVKCDKTNNTALTLSQNKISADMKVRVSPVGGLINLTITKVGILSGV